MAGKKRKERQQREAQKVPRQALDADIDSVSVASVKKRARAPKQHQSEQTTISSDLSAKIIKEALKQQKEIQEEENKDNKLIASFSDVNAKSANSVRAESEDELDDNIDEFDGFDDSLSQYDGGALEIDEDQEKVLAAFMSKENGPQITWGDLFIQKIKENQAGISTDAPAVPKLDSGIIDLYKGVGKFLSRYTHGKIPKAFKHIPSLDRWQDVICLTEPASWSPNAVFQATRIFASNLNPKRAQMYYENVLLPRVRDDVRKNGRLHFALYQSLKKAVYKPAAFFKGILFPLCESGTCNLREAVIIGSIIQKVTIPPLHSSAALMKLAEMEYCGTTSYFIKLFLDKKYALPYRVLDAVLEHFMRFIDDERIMPVIWHQSLLSFVQRYKNELEKKDKDRLLQLMQKQKHYLVTPEIKRELKGSHNRGEKEDDLMSISSVSVVNKPIEEDRWDIPEVPMEED